MKWTKECGVRLRETRQALGWKRDKLGKTTGNGAENLTLWERADRSPEVGDLKVLASVLGASVPYLLCQTDDPKGYENDPPEAWTHLYDSVPTGKSRTPEPPITRDELAVAVRQQRRDMFAAAAMTGLLSSMTREADGSQHISGPNFAQSAWALADEMLEAEK